MKQHTFGVGLSGNKFEAKAEAHISARVRTSLSVAKSIFWVIPIVTRVNYMHLINSIVISY